MYEIRKNISNIYIFARRTKKDYKLISDIDLTFEFSNNYILNCGN